MSKRRQEMTPIFDGLKKLHERPNLQLAPWDHQLNVFKRLASSSNSSKLNEEIKRLFKEIAKEAEKGVNKKAALDGMRMFLEHVAKVDKEAADHLQLVRNSATGALRKHYLIKAFRSPRFAECCAEHFYQLLHKDLTPDQRMQAITDYRSKAVRTQSERAADQLSYDLWTRAWAQMFAVVFQLGDNLLIKMGVEVPVPEENGGENQDEEFNVPLGRRVPRSH